MLAKNSNPKIFTDVPESAAKAVAKLYQLDAQLHTVINANKRAKQLYLGAEEDFPYTQNIPSRLSATVIVLIKDSRLRTKEVWNQNPSLWPDDIFNALLSVDLRQMQEHDADSNFLRIRRHISDGGPNCELLYPANILPKEDVHLGYTFGAIFFRYVRKYLCEIRPKY